jgi:hypothetical protein
MHKKIRQRLFLATVNGALSDTILAISREAWVKDIYPDEHLAREWLRKLHDSYMRDLWANISTRLRIGVELLDGLPANVLARLAVLPHHELCALHSLGGVAAIRQLCGDNFTRDARARLTEALCRSAQRQTLSDRPADAWIYVAKPRQRLRVRARAA